ncbi:hypothetical protein ACLMJK_000357 [Lecanora helva]
MSGPKPTFVLVPGAWHPPSVYFSFLTRLHKAGFPALIVSIPSFKSPSPRNADCQADASAIREQILPLIEDESQDVILICHSYGGIPGGGAAYGLNTRSRRKEGKKGGVVGLIYMCAFVVPHEQSLLNYLGGQHPPYLLRNEPSIGLSVIADTQKTLFEDIDPRRATQLAQYLSPHAMEAFESPAPLAAWAESDFSGRLAFLRCTEDQALPTFLQDMFTDKSGAKWKVKDIKSSHSPWASKPDETVEIVLDCAADFTKA